MIGEPLSGREELTRDEFARRYRFDRFALKVERRGLAAAERPATE